MKYFTGVEDAVNFIRETWGLELRAEEYDSIDLPYSYDSNLAPLMNELREILKK